MTSTKPTKQALIKQLMRYKDDTGCTYEELGKELGYTHGAIYSWVSGTYLPTEKNVDNIKIFLASKGLTTPTARLSDATVNELLTDLRAVKEREGLTLVELGEKIGIAENNLAHWFRGVATPTALNAYHVRNFLAGREKQTNLFENLFDMQVKQSEMTLTAEDGTQYISSRTVAEWTEKRHDHLTRDIENYIAILQELDAEECSPNLGNSTTPTVESYFMAGSYQAEGGQTYKLYWCSRKGCEMIANKMTGKKGVKFTAHYIEVFHSMEQALKETSEPAETPQPQTQEKKLDEDAANRLYIDTLTRLMLETSDIKEKQRLNKRLALFMNNNYGYATGTIERELPWP